MQGYGRAAQIDSMYLEQPQVSLWHTEDCCAFTDGAALWIPNQPAGAPNPNEAWFGPELGFGYAYSLARPDVRVALIKHARGGTNLAEDWNPGTLGDSGTYGSLYAELFQAADQAIAELEADYPDTQIRFRGVVWQQGERDSIFEDMALAYEANLINLIGRLREELDTPELLFLHGVVADTTLKQKANYVYNDLIVAAQRNVDENSGHSAATEGAHVVDSADYPSHGDVIDKYREGDFAHLPAESILRLGLELGNLAATHAPTD